MMNDKPSPAIVSLRLQWLMLTPILRRIAIIALIALDLMVASAFIIATIQLLQERQSYINALNALADPAPPITPQGLLEATQPLSLLNQGMLVHPAGTVVRHDLYALVHNPNSDALALVTFRFMGPSYEGPLQNAFVPPAEDMYLTALGITLPRALTAIRIELQEVRFHRAPRYQEEKAIWLPFTTSDLTHTNEATGAPITHFILKNDGATSFLTLPLLVVLSQGARVVGLSTLTLQKVEAFTSRPVEIRWFEQLPASGLALRIIPLINLYERNQFLEPAFHPQTF